MVIERPYDSPRCTGPSIVERLSCTPSRSESRVVQVHHGPIGGSAPGCRGGVVPQPMASPPWSDVGWAS